MTIARSAKLVAAGPLVAAVVAPAQDKRPAMRDYDPDAIRVPAGYAVEPFATKLNFPVDVAFGEEGEVFVAEAGLHTYGIEKPGHATPAEIVQLLPDCRRRKWLWNWITFG